MSRTNAHHKGLFPQAIHSPGQHPCGPGRFCHRLYPGYRHDGLVRRKAQLGGFDPALFRGSTIVTALGVGLWLSALNVQYRDIRYTLNFIVQFWLFASPVAYSSTLVPARWRPFYGLNPMAGVIEGFRWALLGKTQAPGAMLWVSVIVVALVLVGGLYYYRRMEKTFADVV